LLESVDVFCPQFSVSKYLTGVCLCKRVTDRITAPFPHINSDRHKAAAKCSAQCGLSFESWLERGRGVSASGRRQVLIAPDGNERGISI
jgi:hypothetical protein